MRSGLEQSQAHGKLGLAQNGSRISPPAWARRRAASAPAPSTSKTSCGSPCPASVVERYAGSDRNTTRPVLCRPRDGRGEIRTRASRARGATRGGPASVRRGRPAPRRPTRGSASARSPSGRRGHFPSAALTAWSKPATAAADAADDRLGLLRMESRGLGVPAFQGDGARVARTRPACRAGGAPRQDARAPPSHVFRPRRSRPRGRAPGRMRSARPRLRRRPAPRASRPRPDRRSPVRPLFPWRGRAPS